MNDIIESRIRTVGELRDALSKFPNGTVIFPTIQIVSDFSFKTGLEYLEISHDDDDDEPEDEK